jgi:GT2 family glycosyltransferase
VDISVLLPTRNRPELLAHSISSLLDLAERPEDIEFLLAVDPDAPAELPRGQGQVWTAPERYGLDGLHKYYNHLATLATGTWLMIWNDDAVMTTAGWDALVMKHAPDWVLWPDDNCQPHCNDFPIWPRSWAEFFGYVSLSSRVDTWVQEIGDLLHRQIRVNIYIRHETPADANRDFWAQMPEGKTMSDFLQDIHNNMRGRRIEDAVRIHAARW